jgi:hypothetical protein
LSKLHLNIEYFVFACFGRQTLRWLKLAGQFFQLVGLRSLHQIAQMLPAFE